ncbi:MAG: anaerobic ribonucleoside-triphosphate reductase [Candidatus Thorarchaeota archaeon]|nr:MAG: anaerobic ribonucleoside-triphosphate reductase [Candidatus Thorarchaeota archaeon]
MTDITRSLADDIEAIEAREKRMPKVRSTDSTIESFKAERIIESLVLEARLSRADAQLVAIRVMDRIVASGIQFLSGPLIREMCNSVLAELGFEQARILYTRVGVPMYDLTQLIHDPGTHTYNANLMRNPETIAKLVHDQVMEQHTYLTIPSHLADAHLRGDIYIKDREYFSTRDYCATWDLRQVLALGIAPDGLGGMHSSAAGPAEHLHVAVNHSAIWLAAAQSSFAGGQGYFFYNTFLAPYMRGKSYREIKQAAQQLIFTLTQQYVARGGQVIFSSVDLTPGIPRIMKDVPAILPGGKKNGDTYGDYEVEARQFFTAFMEVMLEGDAKGKGFNFPKPNIVLRKEFMKSEYDEAWRLVAELTAKFGSPYFENYLNWRSKIEAGCSSCCSHLWTASTDEELEEFLTGNMVFGASQMVTPNFGRAAWIGRSDEDQFFTKLDEQVELSKEVILEKKALMDRLIGSGSVPFYTQPKPNGEPLIDMEKREFLLGTVGFSEMSEIITGHALHDREGIRFGIKVLKHLKQRAAEFQEETGLHFGVTRTPAESAAGRLALKDYKKYPGIRKYLKGSAPNVYYTNSTTLDVAAPLPLSDRIRKEAMFHPYMDGGALTHIYLGEANPDPDALWELTKKISRETLVSYFSFTKDVLWCDHCFYQTGIDWSRTKFKTIEDLKKIQCPRCGAFGVEVYSRITGYLQSLSVWNDAKRQEFLDRHRYGV